MSFRRLILSVAPFAVAAPCFVAGCSSGERIGSAEGEQVQGLAILKDIRQTDKAPGEGSSPSGYVEMGGRVYFTAMVGAHEQRAEKLFVTDGTEAGTSEVATLTTSNVSRPPPVVHNGKLYVARRNAAKDVELIESDGTAAGTKVAAMITQGEVAAMAPTLTSTPHGLMFVSSLKADGYRTSLYRLGAQGIERVHKPGDKTGALLEARIVAAGTRTVVLGPYTAPLLTDGTPQGTIAVAGADKASLVAKLGPTSLAFAASDYGRPNVYVYDTATGATTTLAIPKSPQAVGDLRIGALAEVGGKLLVAGAARDAGNVSYAEIWSTDGTPAGTTLVASSHGVAKVGFDLKVHTAEASGKRYFVFDGRVTYATVDGTAATTGPVASFPELQKGNLVSSSIASLTSDGTKLYAIEGGGALEFPFRVQVFDPATGAVTTTSTKDAEPTRVQDGLLPTASGVFYTCYGASTSGEPCRGDGTDAGTKRIKRLGESRLQSSNPEALQRVGGHVYFTADDGVHGRELWVSDGSTGGTRMVKDLTPGLDSTSFDVMGRFADESPRALGSTYFFATTRAASTTDIGAIYRTDGTDAGTWRVDELVPPAHTKYASLPDPIVSGSYLYYVALRADGARELRRSDGSQNGTVTLAEISPPPAGLSAAWGDRLVSTGSHVLAFLDGFGNGVSNVWRSDGTVAGTSKLNVQGLLLAAGHGVAYFGHSWSSQVATQLARYDEATGQVTTEAVPALADPKGGKSFLAATGCAELLGTDVVFYSRSSWTNSTEPVHVWRSNGTNGGTSYLAEAAGGGRSCETYVSTFKRPKPIELPGYAVLPVKRSGVALALVSDGTAAGTQELDLGERGRVVGVSPVKGLLYRQSGKERDTLFSFQGGVVTELADLTKALPNASPFAYTSAPIETAAGLLFTTRADSEPRGRVVELDWATGAFRDVTGGARAAGSLTSLGDRVLLAAEDTNGDRELWSGTVATP